MTFEPSPRRQDATRSMTGIRFYVLFFGAITLLWAVVTLFGHR